MTDIEWSDETWNPILARRLSDGKVGWHCEHASPGCEHCYAETRNVSGRCNLGTKLPFKPGHRKDIELFLDEAALLKPLGWKKPRKVFVCSMTDLFADFVPDEWIDRIFAVMALCPQHTFQVLTKRSGRMREYLSRSGAAPGLPSHRIMWAMDGISRAKWPDLQWPLPNVGLGVSVEDQQRADERIPDLLATPAAVRWISAEPLLGPLKIGSWIPTCYECGATCGLRLAEIPDVERCTECGEECDQETDPQFSEGCPKCNGELEPVCPDCGHYMVYQHPDTPNLDWVVVGGESGAKARPMHPDWARALRDQCAAAGVPFFFKQWGEWWPNPPEALMTIHQFNRQLRYIDVDTGREKTDPTRTSDASMRKVGKKRAGRLLDGVEHNGMPGGV